MEGIPRFAFETTKRMVLNNPQHHFYFIFDRAYDQSLIIADNVTAIVVRPQARHPWLWYWWFEQSLPRVFKKHEIDLFYSPEFYISLRSKVPTLMVSHDIVFETYKDHLPNHQQKYLEKNSPKFHKRADHIMTVSEFGKNELMRQYGLDKTKITAVANACPDGFMPIEDSEKKMIQEKYSGASPYMIFVGAIHPRKNLMNMIRAFKAYKTESNSNLKFLIVGRMAWKSKEVHEAIHNTVDLVYLSNIEDELKPLMAAAEFLFFASLYEGFGIPILEAMKSDIPVITSNITAMKEVGGNAAILVDPLSINEMKDAISSLDGNEDLSRKLVEKGRARVKDFDWNDIAAKVEQQLFALSEK